MHLGAGTYSEVVNHAAGETTHMPRVTPSDLVQSYLWHKLQGDQSNASVGGCCSTMPLGGSLTALEMTRIQTWIQTGAPQH